MPWEPQCINITKFLSIDEKGCPMVSLKSITKALSKAPEEDTSPDASPVEEKKEELTRKELRAIFDPLDERDISQLYGLAQIKRLDRGEIFFSEKEKGDSIFIVLDGKIGLIDDASNVYKSYKPGDIAGVMEFLKQRPRPSASMAIDPSVVMVVEERVIPLLSEKIQNFLYKQMTVALSERVEHLEGRSLNLAKKNRALMRSLYKLNTDPLMDYRSSELVIGIIKKIPKLPAYAHTLSTKLLNEESDSKEIVDLIRQDPSLVADVLKSVNSSYYGLQKKVSDINSAVFLLGFQELYQMVVSEGLRRTMPDTAEFRTLHSQAVITSYFAFALSASSKFSIPIHMTTIGLLHNLGKSVIGLMRQKNPNLSVFVDTLDHPSLGSFLLEEWNIPEKICNTVKHQRFPEFVVPNEIPRDVIHEVTLLYFARLCLGLIRGVSEKDMPMAFFQDYLKIIGLNANSVQDVLDRNVIPQLKKNANRLPAAVKKIIFTDNA